MSYELLLARRRILMASNRVWPTLLYISEAEVSMCCKDCTDGKGGVFQLHPFFDDGLDHKSQCTWTTSDASRATVNGSGLVSFSAATSYGDVTISCAYRGVTKTCLLTVYETMPSAETEGAGLWLCKGGKAPGSTASASAWAASNNIPVPKISIEHTRLIGRYIPVLDNVNYGVLRSVQAGINFVYPQPIGGSSGTPRANVAFTTGNGTVWTRSYQKYFGPSFSNGVKSKVDASLSTDGYSLNGIYYTATTVPQGNTGNQSQFFHEIWTNHDKNICWTGGNAKAHVQLLNYTECLYAYVFQNYIKYTDRDAWVNHTVVPNIGTLGESHNMTFETLPSAWFGV